jgi:4-amino-4-deoxy-L-arabinose transferase-like glycosyltransferase
MNSTTAPQLAASQGTSTTEQLADTDQPASTGQPNGTPPSGMLGSNSGKASGGSSSGGNSSMGGSEKSSITRLFSNNSLSDQIIWLFPLALFGFIAAALKEKLKPAFDNIKKLDLIMWAVWLVPEFIYFSFTTGLFHPYYLTMLAPPIAALSGIGIVAMLELYKECGWKSWILPVALILDGMVQLLILSYYYNTSSIAKALMIILSVLCFVSSIILIILKLTKNTNTKLKNILVGIALIGLLITPLICSGTTLFYKMSGTFPSAGLSLVSSTSKSTSSMDTTISSSTSKLIAFLKSNKTTEKYILVTSSTSGYASEIILNTDESVMTWGFFGTDKILTLAQFKALVTKGEIRYVMIGGQVGSSSDDIMTWVKANGTAVSESKWKDSISTTDTTKTSSSNTQQQNGGNSEALYDLKASTTTTK